MHKLHTQPRRMKRAHQRRDLHEVGPGTGDDSEMFHE
jgi:hypothetical protein